METGHLEEESTRALSYFKEYVNTDGYMIGIREWGVGRYSTVSTFTGVVLECDSNHVILTKS